MARRSKSGGGSRKIGRAKKKCEIYRREHKREKNRIKRLLRLIKKQPNNHQLEKQIHRYEKEV